MKTMTTTMTMTMTTTTLDYVKHFNELARDF